MRSLKLYRHSLRHLGRQKLRTALSTLGIVFGVGSVVAMLSIVEGARRESLEQIEQLGVNNVIVRSVRPEGEAQSQGAGEASSGLRLHDLQLLRDGLPDVECLAPMVDTTAAVLDLPSARRPEIVATTRCAQQAMGLHIEDGRFLADLDVDGSALVCVLGADVSQDLGLKGQRGGTISIQGSLFRIVGLLSERAWASDEARPIQARNPNAMIFVPLGADRSSAGAGREARAPVDEILVRLLPHASVEAGSALVEHILGRAHAGVKDFQVVVPRQLLAQARRTQRLYALVLTCIAAVSLIVGGIGIMNVMLATVSERTKEIGIRRSIGASRRDVLLQFLWEAVSISLVGGIAGIGLGMGAALGMAEWTQLQVLVAGRTMVLALLMAVSVGVMSGLYPSVRAARMDPVVALRHG